MHRQASPRQRLGFGSQDGSALTGRDKSGRPFRAWFVCSVNPGRCPGLACLRAVGPQDGTHSKLHHALGEICHETGYAWLLRFSSMFGTRRRLRAGGTSRQQRGGFLRARQAPGFPLRLVLGIGAAARSAGCLSARSQRMSFTRSSSAIVVQPAVLRAGPRRMWKKIALPAFGHGRVGVVADLDEPAIGEVAVPHLLLLEPRRRVLRDRRRRAVVVAAM